MHSTIGVDRTAATLAPRGACNLHLRASWHTCDNCAQTFESLSALRKHLTVQHDQRGGLRRHASALDMHDGLPTCVRCKSKFTTWYNFRYHIEYVCNSHPEADDLILANHEHRLRVAELLQYATSTDLQALSTQFELCAYFTQKCVLIVAWSVFPHGECYNITAPTTH